MALSEDQKAMLRLLSQREEGYEDIAALMGLSVEEVRLRVKEALAEVDDDATPEMPPQAPEPEPKAEAEAQPAPPRAPEPAQPAAKKPAPGAARPKRPSLPSGISLPKDRGARIGLVAGAVAVVALIVVLAVSGSSNSSSTTTTSANGEQAGAATAASENPELTEATLSPSNGGNASGRALFGRYKKNVLLQVEAEGLDAPPKGQSYTVWLYRSAKLVLRIGAVPVKSGKIAAQLPIPAQVLAYVAGGAFNQVDISLTPDAAYKAELEKAKREKSLPPYTGESVLRGEITGPAIKQQQ